MNEEISLNEFEKIIFQNKGDEDKIKDFINQNFERLPKEIQQEIMNDYLREGVIETIKSKKSEIQKENKNLLEFCKNLKAALEEDLSESEES